MPEEIEDKEPIEPEKIIYQTYANKIDISQVKHSIKKEGINPFSNTDNFSPWIKIEEIIQSQFRILENIDYDVMKTFIQAENKIVNKFNHQVLN